MNINKQDNCLNQDSNPEVWKYFQTSKQSSSPVKRPSTSTLALDESLESLAPHFPQCSADMVFLLLCGMGAFGEYTYKSSTSEKALQCGLQQTLQHCWQQWLKAWAQSASCKLLLQRWQMLGHSQFISIYDFLLLKEKMRIIVTDGCYKTYYHKLGSKYNRVYKLTARCKVRNLLVLDWIYNITLLRACNVSQPYNFSLSNQGHHVWSSVLKTNKE